MDLQTHVKVGDKLVDYDNIFEVFKIKKEKTTNTDSENVVYFKPFFKNDRDTGLVCSIPQSSLSQTNIRKPVSHGKMREVIISLNKSIRLTYIPDANELKEMMKDNDPENLVRILKIIQREKKSKDNVISRSKKIIYDQAIKRLSREYAYVGKMSESKAQEKIIDILEK